MNGTTHEKHPCPTCQHTMSMPEGARQVTCPACGTPWWPVRSETGAVVAFDDIPF
jgi:LSD1 subclass zinc finger protein